MSENNASAGAATMHDAGEALRAEGLGKTYAEGKLKTHVFDGLDLRVAAGETVAIVGASGAGKSTLLHLLGGLDTPSAGEVYVAGQKMSALSDAQRGKLRNRALGFVYQFHHLLPEFTALENVMMPVMLAGGEVEEARQRASTLLESVGLGHRLRTSPASCPAANASAPRWRAPPIQPPGLRARRRAHRQPRREDRGHRVRADARAQPRPAHQPYPGHPRPPCLTRRLDRVLELHEGRLRELAPQDLQVD